MNNKGFTLIELIATIALLAIIVTISFVSINSIITQSKIKNCETLVNNIKTATKEYISDNRYKNLDINNFTVDKLIDSKYLSGPIYDPFDKSQELDSSEISIIIELNNDYTAKNIVVEGLICER